jgi:hypothetical protein
LPAILHTLHEIFTQILQDLLHTGDQVNKFARLVIRSVYLDTPISVAMMPHRELSAEKVLSMVERVMQSRKQFLLDSNLQINFIITKVPEGKGKRFKPKTLKIDDMLKNKRSIIRIPTGTDNLCLAKALVVGKVYADYPSATDKSHLQMKKIIKRSPKRMLSLAKVLHSTCGVVDTKPCYDLSDVKTFQMHLPGYQIIVLSQKFFNAIVYQGPPAKKIIILYQENNHFHVITKLNAFFSNTDYYCHKCTTTYRLFYEHARCVGCCPICLHSNCFNSDLVTKWHYCEKCNRYFKHQLCFKNHKLKSSTRMYPICDKLVKCLHCNKIVTRSRSDTEKHQCGKKMCKSCKQWVVKSEEDMHKCHIQPLDLDPVKDSKKKRELYFFDIETDQSTFTHVATLVVLQGEGDKVWSFVGKGTSVPQFCDFILTQKFSNSIVIAHNAANFDLYFIMNYLFSSGIKIQTIYRESSIMQIKVLEYNITFKDSYLFIPTRLSNFPDLFDFEGAKSYFPHLFPYGDYIGEYLHPIFYGYNSMSPSARLKFLEWYNIKIGKGEVFNYKKNLIDYCKIDVEILRKGCMIFRDIILSTGYTDPWAEGITLTQVCSIIFRKRFLLPNSIALIPHQGYTNPKLYSTKGIKWLEYRSKQDGVFIRHARNLGELKILE